MTDQEHNASSYPFKDTVAATMLADGLEAACKGRGISLRSLGKELGYKQATVLSHMATGRIPIPLERAIPLADAAGIDQNAFLLAVLTQRYPEVGWDKRFNVRSVEHPSGYAGQLAGTSLADLSTNHRAIAEELVRDTHPDERWLTISEIAIVAAIRAARPDVRRVGISQSKLSDLRQFLEKAE